MNIQTVEPSPTLPIEILQNIFSHCEDNQSINAINFVSKDWQTALDHMPSETSAACIRHVMTASYKKTSLAADKRDDTCLIALPKEIIETLFDPVNNINGELNEIKEGLNPNESYFVSVPQIGLEGSGLKILGKTPLSEAQEAYLIQAFKTFNQPPPNHLAIIYQNIVYKDKDQSILRTGQLPNYTYQHILRDKTSDLSFEYQIHLDDSFTVKNAQGEVTKSFNPGKGPINAATLLGNTFIAFAAKGQIHLFDIQQERVVQTLGNVNVNALAADGYKLAYREYNGKAYEIDFSASDAVKHKSDELYTIKFFRVMRKIGIAVKNIFKNAHETSRQILSHWKFCFLSGGALAALALVIGGVALAFNPITLALITSIVVTVLVMFAIGVASYFLARAWGHFMGGIFEGVVETKQQLAPKTSFNRLGFLE